MKTRGKDLDVVFDRKCLEYDFPGHPESSERVRSTYDFLKKKGGFRFIKPEECSRQDLLGVHSEEMVDKVKHGETMSPDTPADKSMYNYAKLSAGGAILAMETALKKGKCFSLMRPPGHHAGRSTYEGFCYFNNVAIAVMKAMEKVEKTAILDIDCHFGQGTQEIFLGNRSVLCVSLHQDGIYPGGGKHSESNCINYPMDGGTEESRYLGKLEVAIEKIKEFGPDFLAVSAGFDTFEKDPLAGLGLEKGSYGKIAEMISALGLPTFVVLEGGYSRELPECVYSFLEKL